MIQDTIYQNLTRDWPIRFLTSFIKTAPNCSACQGPGQLTPLIYKVRTLSNQPHPSPVIKALHLHHNLLKSSRVTLPCLLLTPLLLKCGPALARRLCLFSPPLIQALIRALQLGLSGAATLQLAMLQHAVLISTHSAWPTASPLCFYKGGTFNHMYTIQIKFTLASKA